MNPAAIVLAGGRGSRLGGVDKGAVQVGGIALLDTALQAVAGAEPIVVVGPGSAARPGTVRVREEPAFAGPAAAVVAGLAELAHLPDDAATWLLACDLPHAPGLAGTVRTHLAHTPLTGDEDGAVIVDQDGRDQWLAGLYRLGALRRGAERLGNPEGAPLKRLLADLNLRRIPDDSGDALDVDTPEDLAAARERAACEDGGKRTGGS